MDTQRAMIYQYLKDCGSITPLDALREFGCMRLGARICELRSIGLRIETEREHAVNRYGRKVSFARYRLAEEDRR